MTTLSAATLQEIVAMIERDLGGGRITPQPDVEPIDNAPGQATRRAIEKFDEVFTRHIQEAARA